MGDGHCVGDEFDIDFDDCDREVFIHVAKDLRRLGFVLSFFFFFFFFCFAYVWPMTSTDGVLGGARR